MIKHKVWIDGVIVDRTSARVPVLSHSLCYASSVYEGVRVYNGTMFMLDEHLKRLKRSCQRFMHLPRFSIGEIRNACTSLVDDQKVADGYVKILVYYDDADTGFGGDGCRSCVAISVLPVPILPGAPDWRLSIATWRRPDSMCHPYDAKTSSTYALSFLSFRMREPWADDVLFLSQKGAVCESSGANIFFVTGRNLVTPPANMSLDGITRRLILDELAAVSGYTAEVREVTANDIWRFDGAFLCGTATEVRNICQIDRVSFKCGRAAGDIKNALLAKINLTL